MNVVPYEHQKKTVEFLNSHSAGLNTSECGTGKTLPSMIVMSQTTGKCVVVCPSFLARNWRKELKNFVDVDAGIYPDMSKRITIISQELIYKDAKVFHDLDVLVVDEIHSMVNMNTRRTKALHTYVKEFKPKKFIGMSGTPMRNKTPELYSLLLLLDYYYNMGFRQLYPSQWAFNTKFCQREIFRIHGREIVKWYGARNVDTLRGYLAGKFIKFKLDELTDLPPIVHEEVEVDCVVNSWTEEELESGWTVMELGAPPPSHFSQLKKANAVEKVPFAIDYLKNLLDADLGPIIIFSDHVEPCELIQAAIPNSACITGKTPIPARDAIVANFQDGKIPVLAVTIKALGTGITLTRSNLLIFLDRSYVPGENHQAMYRFYRISQTRRCRVIHLNKPGIDTRINNALREKEKLIGKILDDEFETTASKNDTSVNTR